VEVDEAWFLIAVSFSARRQCDGAPCAGPTGGSMSVLVFLFVGAISGWLASLLVKGSGLGF
jgi:hypothetical protein